MEERKEINIIVGEVRGRDQTNKLLFRLGTYQNKLVILLKQRGNDSCYMVPISDLLEPFVENRAAIETATTVFLNRKNVCEEKEEIQQNK